VAPLTNATLNELVVQLYRDDGLSVRAVARAVGRSKTRVQQILDKENVPRRLVGTGKEK
jgi:predicted HTH domain antitoxin